MKSIEVIISPTGTTTVQTRGFVGESCRDASQALEKALGTVQSKTPTAESYQGQAVEPILPQGNG